MIPLGVVENTSWLSLEPPLEAHPNTHCKRKLTEQSVDTLSDSGALSMIPHSKFEGNPENALRGVLHCYYMLGP